MEPSRIVNGIKVKLVGGPLDGDSFELTPNGSVLPPARLSYYYRAQFPLVARWDPKLMRVVLPEGAPGFEECACWLHYECKDHVPEWSEKAVTYTFSGKEKLKEDR